MPVNTDDLDGPDSPLIRDMLLDWITTERAEHADKDQKYAPGSPGRLMLIEAMRTEGYGQTWGNFIDNYLFRAEKQYGLQTEQGRQAMGKAIVALMHCLETACYVYGDMPRPGLPSGEVEPWLSDNLTWDDPAGYVPPDPNPAPEGD